MATVKVINKAHFLKYFEEVFVDREIIYLHILEWVLQHYRQSAPFEIVIPDELEEEIVKMLPTKRKIELFIE